MEKIIATLLVLPPIVYIIIGLVLPITISLGIIIMCRRITKIRESMDTMIQNQNFLIQNQNIIISQLNEINSNN